MQAIILIDAREVNIGIFIVKEVDEDGDAKIASHIFSARKRQWSGIVGVFLMASVHFA